MPLGYDKWIGVDLDGTMAVYDGWKGAEHVGEPLPEMVSRVRTWIAQGKNVRIITARAFAPPDNPIAQRDAAHAVLAIQDWSLKHLGAVLPITCVKDYGMEEIWDDRAIQMERNTGKPVEGSFSTRE
jgi:hypothetical protein